VFLGSHGVFLGIGGVFPGMWREDPGAFLDVGRFSAAAAGASVIFPKTQNTNTQQTNTTMKRQNYYPGRIGAQVLWLDNFATKLAIYAPNLTIPTGESGAAMDDAKWCGYVLGEWLPAVRAFSPSTTDAVDDALTGSGSSAIAMPTFTAPALPSGVTARNPGALTRIFTMVGKIKLDAAYTEAMGTDLGIVGSEDTGLHPVPKFTPEALPGIGVQVVRLTFFKYTHMGVYIESRRGTGAWEFLGIDTVSPYMDERALLTPGTPEMREYRMRYWDKGTPNGDWTDVAKVTVSP
jgi:hypothetical protein